jgi:hypothetical protein
MTTSNLSFSVSLAATAADLQDVCGVRAGAYGPLAKSAATRVACASSYLKTCDRMICMDELTTDRVVPLLLINRTSDDRAA